MGQIHSRQATPVKSQITPRRNGLERRRSKRTQRTTEVHVDDSWVTPKSSNQDGRTARTRTAISDQLNRNGTHPLREVGGNAGAPRREQKYGRDKASNDQNKPRAHQRNRKDDKLGSSEQPKESTSPTSRSYRSKPGYRHMKTPSTKECIICTDARSLYRFPDRPPTEQCTHDADACRRCLRTWIQTEFSAKIWNEISCPICAARMQYDDIRQFAPRNVFRRYAKLTTKAVYDNIPDWRWCITKGCKSGQIHPPDQLRFRCKTCKKSHCVEHLSDWHRGETCREYDYRTNKSIKKQEEIASKKIILETTKKCPRCKRSIEKSFGCDHMTCSKCKHEFCWQCLGPYIKKGVRRAIHRQGCEYYNPAYDSD